MQLSNATLKRIIPFLTYLLTSKHKQKTP